jgi:CRISPR/Cas system-associated exonuclease Cas4 (RecB family)
MHISYHGWKSYKECPKKFLLKHIQKAPPTVPVNEYFTLYGRLTGKFFELFSNIWRLKTPYIFPEIIRERLQVLYKDILLASTVNWSAPFAKYTQSDIFEQAFTDVCTIMDSMQQNYFLSTRSEVEIQLKLKDETELKGRIDFIHTEPLSKDVLIIDGKGTDTIGKNVSNDQLLFYALLYYFQTKVVPKSLGFFYYRFNTLIPVPISEHILNEFRAKLSLDVKTIVSDKEFKATPCAKSCKYCDYARDCLEGIESKGSRAKKSRLKLEGSGFIEFGF